MMSWFGNKDLGYEVTKSGSKYKIYINEHYGCATEWVAVFKTRRMQEAIELRNALNEIEAQAFHSKPTEIKTKHYKFKNDHGRWELIEIDYSKYVGEDFIEGFIEIIRRKNRRIAALKSDYVSAKYEAEKYKTMLFDLYDKMNEKSENDKYWEIFQFLYKDDGVKDVHSKLDSVDTLGKIKKSLRRS